MLYRMLLDLALRFTVRLLRGLTSIVYQYKAKALSTINLYTTYNRRSAVISLVSTTLIPKYPALVSKHAVTASKLFFNQVSPVSFRSRKSFVQQPNTSLEFQRLTFSSQTIMQFVTSLRSFATMALLLASVQAAPAPTAMTATTRTHSPLTNDCGPSSFTDESSSASPTVADCQQLAANIAGGGSWTLSLGVRRTLATYGTCAFGAETTGIVTYIGNEDIIDLINSSIGYYSWDGLVGAKGTMSCQETDVIWGIFHT